MVNLRATIIAAFMMVFCVAQATAQSPVTSQIHNAPGWEPTTSYTYTVGPPANHKARVVNGAGWNGTSFTYGSALNAYELIAPTSGSCTSAGSGGPSGTGSSITDGGCTWKYLSGVDYTTITGWINDNGIPWTTGVTHYFSDVVYLPVAPYSAFALGYDGGSTVLSSGCVSTIAPTIAASGTLLADGCNWVYFGDITYSSGANTMPTQTFPWHWTITACIGANSSCNSTGNKITVSAIAGGGPMTNPDAPPNLFAGGANGVSAINGGSGPRLCPEDIGATATVASPGTGYAVNDTITMGDGSSVFVTPAVLTVTSISGGGGTGPITGVSLTTPGLYTQPHGNPLFPSATSGSGTGAAFNMTFTFAANWGTGEYIACDNFANPVTTSAIASQTMVVINASVTQYNLTASAYNGVLWNDQEYVAGSNHESSTIITRNHDSRHNDSLGVAAASSDSGRYLYPAAGESAATTLANNPSQPISTTYNPNLGVSINGGASPAMCVWENKWEWDGLQLSSTNGPGIDGLNFDCPIGGEQRACNNCVLNQDIVYTGVNSTGACECGAVLRLQDNVIVTKGFDGQTFDYPGYFLNNTLVNVGSRSSTVAIQSVWNWQFACGMQIFGNAVYGFDGFYAYLNVAGTLNLLQSQCSPDPANMNGDITSISFWMGSNVTDTSSSAAVNSYWPSCNPSNSCGPETTGVAGLPGVTFSSSMSSAFLNTSNLRSVSPSSTLYGARSSLASIMTISNGQQGIGGISGLDTCPQPSLSNNSYWDGELSFGNPGPCMLDPDGVDVVGTSRPQSQGFDIGAVQSTGGTVPPGNIFPFVHGMFGSADAPLKYAETAK